MEGQDAWGPLAIADGYLVMRDSKTMVCLDMAARRQ
jgi:outer membrane protein assembly factor BamB